MKAFSIILIITLASAIVPALVMWRPFVRIAYFFVKRKRDKVLPMIRQRATLTDNKALQHFLQRPELRIKNAMVSSISIAERSAGEKIELYISPRKFYFRHNDKSWENEEF